MEQLAGQIQQNPGAARPLYLLTLLGADRCSAVEGRTRLIKLMFLVQKRVIEELKLGITRDAYNFRAFNYGPYSEDVYADFEFLRIRGLAQVDGDDEAVQRFHLTPRGQAMISRLVTNRTISPAMFDETQRIKQTYGKLSLEKLLARVYAQYPAFTTRSLIKERFG